MPITRPSEFEAYSSEAWQLHSLPRYLYRKNNQLNFYESAVKEGEKGPFDIIGSFNHSLKFLQPPVTNAELPSLESFLKHTTFLDSDPSINHRMMRISEMVNEPGRTSEILEDRLEYQDLIKPVALAALQKTAEKIAVQNPNSPTYLLCPLNGGLFMTDLYKENPDWPLTQIIEYRAARVITHAHHYHVGIRRISPIPEIPKYSNVIFADDCIAAVGTALASLKLLPPPQVNLYFASTALTLRGAVALESALPQLGFDRYEIVSGAKVRQLNSDYYLMRTEEENFPEGSFYVGDMGAWLKR
jgi:hypothetical protein